MSDVKKGNAELREAQEQNEKLLAEIAKDKREIERLSGLVQNLLRSNDAYKQAMVHAIQEHRLLSQSGG